MGIWKTLILLDLNLITLNILKSSVCRMFLIISTKWLKMKLIAPVFQLKIVKELSNLSYWACTTKQRVIIARSLSQSLNSGLSPLMKLWDVLRSFKCKILTTANSSTIWNLSSRTSKPRKSTTTFIQWSNKEVPKIFRRQKPPLCLMRKSSLIDIYIYFFSID